MPAVDTYLVGLWMVFILNALFMVRLFAGRVVLMQVLKSFLGLVVMTILAFLALLLLGSAARGQTMTMPVPLTPQAQAAAPSAERTAPRITHFANVQDPFLVEFDKGATWACTMFQLQRKVEPGPNWPDGYYTPRHCWALDESMQSYPDNFKYIVPENDDWLVWAEVGYYTGPNSAGPGQDITYYPTNKVRVRH